MQALIWIGAVITLAGVAGVLWCVIRVARAKRANLADDELRAELAGVLPVNLAALLVSAIGLMCVVVGILLG